jgi:hypothetical protein
VLAPHWDDSGDSVQGGLLSDARLTGLDHENRTTPCSEKAGKSSNLLESRWELSVQIVTGPETGMHTLLTGCRPTGPAATG